MDKIFEKPTIEFLKFSKRDIITTSVPSGGTIPDDGGVIPPFDDFQ